MRVAKVRDLGPQFVENKFSMVGQDGSYSIPFDDHSLWFFGDTMIGKRTENESLWYPGGEQIGPGNMAGTGGITRMLTNTALILKNNDAENGLTNFDYLSEDSKNLQQIIPYLENEDEENYRIWCFHGINLEDSFYLFYQKVEMLDGGSVLPVNFRIIGSGLAKGNKQDWRFTRLENNGETIFWNDAHPQFASAVLLDEKSNTIYLYGVKMNEEKTQQCFVAKVKPEYIQDISKYEYLSEIENQWSSDIDKAIPLFNGMPNELSISFNKYLNKYLAVHSLDLTGNIVARTSETPWGPWSEEVILFNIKVERKIDLPYPILTYAAKEHPVLAKLDGKKIYITYIEFEEYYPHLIEVEFE